MTKLEFLEILKKELQKSSVADCDEIIYEYEQHFAFKLKDGYSEEEISAKLGSPIAIAGQFDKSETPKNTAKKIPALIGLGILDFFTLIFCVVLICFGIVIAAFTVCSATGAFCLIGNANIYNLIPSMPYHVAIVFGVTLIVLAVISAVGFIYYVALIKQLFRSYKRFHCNTVAIASGNTTLPAIPATPQLTPKVHRILRKIFTVSFLSFVFLFVASFAVAIVTAGNFEFWHSWEWFGYGA